MASPLAGPSLLSVRNEQLWCTRNATLAPACCRLAWTGYPAPPPRIIMMGGGARSDNEPRALRSAFGRPIGEQNHFARLLAYGLPPRWQLGDKPR